MLPSSSFVNSATGSIFEQFLYFSRPIQIYKQPIETIINQPTDLLYGYNGISQSNNSQTTLSEDFTTFSGLVISPLKSRGSSNSNFDNKIVLENNKTYLKLLPEAHQFLTTGGKIEKIIVDDITYNLEGAAQIAYFMNLRFYYYQIQATN